MKPATTLPFLGLAALSLLATGCGSDTVLRRGEPVRIEPSLDALVVLGLEGAVTTAEVQIEARSGAVIWLNRSARRSITIVIPGAELVEGVAAVRHMAQHPGFVATDRTIPPGGIASVRLAVPGRFPYEVHGLDAPVRGSIHVLPAREGGSS